MFFSCLRTAGALLFVSGLTALLPAHAQLNDVQNPDRQTASFEIASPHTPQELTPAGAAPLWSPAPGDLLWDNGGFVTHPGEGDGGADVSLVPAIPNDLAGSNVWAPYRLADRFVTRDHWRVSSIVTYAYETFATEPTWTGGQLRIWDGMPGEADSSLLYSRHYSIDELQPEFSGVYRVFHDDPLTNTDRAIHGLTWPVSPEQGRGLLLPPSEYWIDWQLSGGNSAWGNAVMAMTTDDPPEPVFVVGHARQMTGGEWQWAGNIHPEPMLSLPFKVTGTVEPVLYDNGGMTTHPAQGSDGWDVSQASGLLTGSTVTGNSHLDFRLADDFYLLHESGLSAAVVYVYQTNLSPPNWTGGTLRIWDGEPGTAGSDVIFVRSYDTVDAEPAWIYRVHSTGSLSNTDRPIHALSFDLTDASGAPLLLSAGSYWLEWQIEANQAVYAPLSMWIDPENDNAMTMPGNARQYDNVQWGLPGDSPAEGVSLPFQIHGAPIDELFKDRFE